MRGEKVVVNATIVNQATCSPSRHGGRRNPQRPKPREPERAVGAGIKKRPDTPSSGRRVALVGRGREIDARRACQIDCCRCLTPFEENTRSIKEQGRQTFPCPNP